MRGKRTGEDRATSSWTGAMILPQTPHTKTSREINPQRLVDMPHSDSWLNTLVTPQFLPPPNSKNYFSAIFHLYSSLICCYECLELFCNHLHWLLCLNGSLFFKCAYLLFILLAQRTCIFNMLWVINTGEHILTAANYFILYHRYNILMLSLLRWSYWGGMWLWLPVLTLTEWWYLPTDQSLWTAVWNKLIALNTRWFTTASMYCKSFLSVIVD